MNKVYGIIYKVKNDKNKKVYIGQTTKTNGFKGRYWAKGEGVERILNCYIAQKEYGEPINEHLYNSILKYGADSFSVVEEIDRAYSKSELDDKEMYWIRFYNSSDRRYGYNKTVGGTGQSLGRSAYLKRIGVDRKPLICLDTREVFLDLAEAEKATGIRQKNIREACRGEREFAISRRHNKKYKFKYISIEKGRQKPVICLNTNEVFLSIIEASRCYKVDRSQIHRCCEGIAMTAGKHPVTSQRLRWMYALDHKLETLDT